MFKIKFTTFKEKSDASEQTSLVNECCISYNIVDMKYGAEWLLVEAVA